MTGQETKKRVLNRSVYYILVVSLIIFLFIITQTRDKESLEDMNVILITLDTTRADYIGAYGKAKADTPNIDKIAGEGTIFTKCITQTPLTLPTHLSMLTGTYPLYNKVRDNVGFRVPQKLEFLSETLKKKEYSTAAFVSTFVLHSKWGMNQGFDTYSDNFNFNKFSIVKVQQRGDITLQKAKDWIGKNKKNKFFSWIHLYDPHTPYSAPEPFGSKYPNNPYRGEIEFMDSILGKFFQFLKDEHLYDKSIIILVGDHGEGLGQHGEPDHGFFIYNETVHVPLIIRTPNNKLKKKIRNYVEIVDIAPTVLSMLKIKQPNTYQGESLYKIINGKSKRKKRIAYTESYFPRFHFGWSELKGFYFADHYKYIIAPKEELYDLSVDPEEKNNIILKKRRLLKKYKGKFKNFIKIRMKNAIKLNAESKLSASDMARFRSLGYLGEGIGLSKNKNLGNPKDKINILRSLSKAILLITNKKKYDEAILILEDILKEENGIMDVMLYLGNAYKKKGMYEKALHFYQEIIKKKPDSFTAMFNILNTLSDMGNLSKALITARKYIHKFPNDFTLYNKLGIIYFRMKQYRKALETFQKTINLEKTNSIALAEMGRVYMSMKDYDKAKEYLEKAKKLNPKQFELNFLFGLLADKTGNKDKALNYYKEEIKINSKSSKALYNLAVQLIKEGNQSDAEKYFKRVINLRPRFNFPYFMVAKCIYEDKTKLREARRLCEIGLRIGTRDKYTVYGYLLLSDIYHRLGQDELAQENFNEGIALKKQLGQ